MNVKAWFHGTRISAKPKRVAYVIIANACDLEPKNGQIYHMLQNHSSALSHRYPAVLEAALAAMAAAVLAAAARTVSATTPAKQKR